MTSKLENAAFYSDTAEGGGERCKTFYDTAAELGFQPIFYSGGRNEHDKANTAYEMRGDLLASRAAFVYVGEPTYTDNFALLSYGLANETGVRCYLILDPNVEQSMLSPYVDVAEVIRLTDRSEFEGALRSALLSLDGHGSR